MGGGKLFGNRNEMWGRNMSPHRDTTLPFTTPKVPILVILLMVAILPCPNIEQDPKKSDPMAKPTLDPGSLER